METQLESVRRKEITFDQFILLTANDWNRLSSKLYYAWQSKLPAGVSIEDIRQELLMNAFEAFGNFDDERGQMTLKQFVVYRAFSKTLRFIHSQRCAKRRGDHAESRHPVSFSEIQKSESEWVDALLVVEPKVEQMLDVVRQFDAALHSADGIDLYALVALRETGGHIGEAGNLLFEEVDIRLQKRWGSPAQAVAQIEDTLMRVYS